MTVIFVEPTERVIVAIIKSVLYGRTDAEKLKIGNG